MTNMLQNLQRALLQKQIRSMVAVSSPTAELKNHEHVLRYLDPISPYQLITSLFSYPFEALDLISQLLPFTVDKIIDICLPFRHVDNTTHFARYLLMDCKLIGIRLRTGSSWKRYACVQYKVPQRILKVYQQIGIPIKDRPLTIQLGQFLLNTASCRIALLYVSELIDKNILSEHLQYGCEMISVVNDMAKDSFFAHNLIPKNLQNHSLQQIQIKKFVLRNKIIGVYGGANVANDKLYIAHSFVVQEDVCDIETKACPFANGSIIKAPCDFLKAKTLKRYFMPSQYQKQGRIFNKRVDFWLQKTNIQVCQETQIVQETVKFQSSVPSQKCLCNECQKDVNNKSITATKYQEEEIQDQKIELVAVNQYKECSSCLVREKKPTNIKITCNQCKKLYCFQCQQDLTPNMNLVNWVCRFCKQAAQKRNHIPVCKLNFECQTDDISQKTEAIDQGQKQSKIYRSKFIFSKTKNKNSSKRNEMKKSKNFGDLAEEKTAITRIPSRQQKVFETKQSLQSIMSAVRTKGLSNHFDY